MHTLLRLLVLQESVNSRTARSSRERVKSYPRADLHHSCFVLFSLVTHDLLDRLIDFRAAFN
jgi:hypothetical protein